MNEEPQTILPGNASFKPKFFQLQTNFHFPFPSSHPCRLKKSTQQASLPISKKCLPLSSGSFPLSPKNSPHSLSNRHAPSVLATRSSLTAFLFCSVVSPSFQIVVFFFPFASCPIWLFKNSSLVSHFPSPSILFSCPRTAQPQGGKKEKRGGNKKKKKKNQRSLPHLRGSTVGFNIKLEKWIVDHDHLCSN